VQKYIKKRTSKTKQHKKKAGMQKKRETEELFKKIKTNEKKTQLL
jgi:hypothetical protein